MQDRECFRVTLEKWSQLNVGVTWGNLELAITNVNRGSLGLEPLTAGKWYILYVAKLTKMVIHMYLNITIVCGYLIVTECVVISAQQLTTQSMIIISLVVVATYNS